jgi:D-ribose pyranase
MKRISPSILSGLEALMNGVPISAVPHEELKKLHTVKIGNIAYLRTGETTPYANVVLEAGVTFG